jgi:GTP-binding protein Era
VNKTDNKTEKKTDSKTITNDNNFKSGFVAIIGRPNVGKSTLLNTLSEMRLAIVSSKPQTTRHNIKLILNEEDSQIIFTDTPGIHLPKTKLAKKMVDLAYEALSDADVLLLMIDATKPKISLIETKCCELAQKFKKKVILIINKVDLIPKEDLFPIITKYSGMHSFDAIIPISVKDDDGIDILKKEIIKLLPVGPQYFPEDAITDQTERGITSELIREQILRFTSQEIPHGTAVEIEKFVESDNEEDESESIVRISAVIYCERDSHKKMLIGKNGEMIKRIGTHARKEIEKLLQSKVFLELHVKVREDWRNSHAILTNLGYK